MTASWARLWFLFRITLSLRASSVKKSLKEAIEQDLDRLFLWTPVLMGFGIGLYFILPTEPPLYASLLLFAVAFALVLWRKDRLLPRLPFFFFLGFALICLASRFYGTPMIDSPVGPTMLEGVIESIEQRSSGLRLLIDQPFIEDLSPQRTPKQVYVVLTERTAKHQNIDEVLPGMRLKAMVQLLPLSAPLSPRGFDFRLNGYFKSVGATGYILGKTELTSAREETTFSRFMNGLRLRIQDKIRHSMEGDAAGLTITLLTGEKKILSDETNEAMRTIGLAHLLAISGLHVSLLAGIIFFMVRGFFALIPAIALRYPIKKWAVFPALLAILFYLFLVGAPASARRATLMTGIILIGVLFDKASLSLHTVTMAAIVILFFSPHLLLNPGFQLSFAAVLALISLHEFMKKNNAHHENSDKNIAQKTFHFLWNIAVMSLAATLATAPLSLYHFQEASLYALFANTLAIPLTSFWLMPLCVFFAMLWPFGLEALPLKLLQPGLHALIDLSHWIASLPGAYYKPPQMPLELMLIGIMGGLFFCLTISRLRWLGLVVLLGSIGYTFFQPRPVVLISSEGTSVGWRTPDTRDLVITSTEKPDTFLSDVWSPLAGMGRDKAPYIDSAPNLTCDSLGCLWTALPQPILWIKDPAILPQECESDATLIISPASYSFCPKEMPRVINRLTLRQHGAHAVFVKNGQITVTYEREAPAQRPWSLGWRPPKSF